MEGKGIKGEFWVVEWQPQPGTVNYLDYCLSDIMTCLFLLRRTKTDLTNKIDVQQSKCLNASNVYIPSAHKFSLLPEFNSSTGSENKFLENVFNKNARM